MSRPPVVTSSWDDRRRAVTYKVTIEGTGKFLLFSEDTLCQLQSQIESAIGRRESEPSYGGSSSEALKGTDRGPVRT